MKVKVGELSLTLCHPMDCIVYGILQTRVLEGVAFPFSRGSSQPRDQTKVSTLQADSLPAEPPGKSKNTEVGSLSLLQRIFLMQESNWCLLHCIWILYQLSYQGSLYLTQSPPAQLTHHPSLWIRSPHPTFHHSGLFLLSVWEEL